MKIFSSVFTKNDYPNSHEGDDLDRPMSVAEKRRMFKKWKVQKDGTAGIPSSWMWKELDSLTLAEAIAYHEALRSGRTWGEIQLDGISGDTGYLRDFEYDQFFGYRANQEIDSTRLDEDGRINLGRGRWSKHDK